MPVTRNVQYPAVAVAEVELGVTSFTSAVAFALAGVPANAYVVGGGVNVVTAFDSGTSDVLDVGDGADPDRYSATPIDLQSTGYTALDLTGYVYTAADDIDAVITNTGTAATAGKVVISIEYIVLDRGHEVAY